MARQPLATGVSGRQIRGRSAREARFTSSRESQRIRTASNAVSSGPPAENLSSRLEVGPSRDQSAGCEIVCSVATEPVSVRLVEWNVAMSLQSKTHLLVPLKPTVAILPESAHPDRTWSALQAIGATSVQWIGGNANKGLLAVAFDGWNLRIDDNYDPGYQWVMPLHLSGPMNLRVLAVWDMGNRGSGYESARKLGACRASVEHYSAFLSGECDLAVISGDFKNSVRGIGRRRPPNSATSWTRSRTAGLSALTTCTTVACVVLSNIRHCGGRGTLRSRITSTTPSYRTQTRSTA